MSIGRASGLDKAAIEVVVTARPVGMQWLYMLIRKIWESRMVTKDWGKEKVVPIFKKGGSAIITVGVSLVIHFVKVF